MLECSLSEDVWTQSGKSEAGNGGVDRRAARTRRALHGALISLILRKGYDAITVQEIIDEADVGRATFYAHYRGKEDLLRGGFEELRAELKTARRADSSKQDAEQDAPLSFRFAMFEHACAYRDVYRAMVGGRGGMIASQEIRRVLSERVKELARDPSRKIEAIKVYREETGTGLKDAKDAVEAFIDSVQR